MKWRILCFSSHGNYWYVTKGLSVCMRYAIIWYEFLIAMRTLKRVISISLDLSLPRRSWTFTEHSWKWASCTVSTLAMFRWEPEGHYRHSNRLCTMIMPVWFSTEHLWIAATPFWLSTDACDFCSPWITTQTIITHQLRARKSMSIAPFWFSTEHCWTARLNWGWWCILRHVHMKRRIIKL